ncbi:putative exonuclease, RecJ [Thalassoporum mexicanum PCC 7367]|uniref:single-stranded-DNA-specific exonuclease RecJ n=1 Tax=Thalassoporum mexicanum TaxID=3457544 RepID=UPI00029FEFA3|nr:single-stranded-DNA-specific exonuclease RecJ [Pseudanabaena sp. PCC 7367]AFY70190.1 putative exonuclease, RecJ [Pseudanabaena sp. PCC 7367]
MVSEISAPEQPKNWQLLPQPEPPAWLIDRVGQAAAILLWQRGIQSEPAIEAYLNPELYVPTSGSAFGQEMELAIERIKQAIDHREQVAIWGDFDADGITATALLWDGLGQFFAQNEELFFFIPNRQYESHGLSIKGIDHLLTEHPDCSLIITCDTGSTDIEEIEHARSLGIDVIITDHHTLPAQRPKVVAIINPRYLEPNHPLYHLSGVAVAYKLVEALYAAMPDIPQQPLAKLLDLLAIGLVADLVALVGDCRYLAQIGIEQLKHKEREGIRQLLEACKRAGDRPTDISFGIAPRINSISRIWGDVSNCVALLTSKDPQTCARLVELAELANTQRKALQKSIYNQAQAKIAQLDLSTQGVIILADAQWSAGILGLVAGQVSGEYARPVILLQLEDGIARGSARSPQGINLYELIKGQEHLLNSFGGHPLAAGMSLAAENLPLFKAAIEQRFWSQYSREYLQTQVQRLEIDLVVKIKDLGQLMFRQLKQLEPFGMGNPIPKLLVKNCWFDRKFNAKLKNRKGQKVEYIKTEFCLIDETGEINGHWWGHYSHELPEIGMPCDVVVELVDNAYKREYQVRLLDFGQVHTTSPIAAYANNGDSLGDRYLNQFSQELPRSPQSPNVTKNIELLDYRGQVGIFSLKESESESESPKSLSPKSLDLALEAVVICDRCPTSWQELENLLNEAQEQAKPIVLTYAPPQQLNGWGIWQRLVGIAKYLERTGKSISIATLSSNLGIGDRNSQIIDLGLAALDYCGWSAAIDDNELQHISFGQQNSVAPDAETREEHQEMVDSAALLKVNEFIAAVDELVFRQRYFDQQVIAKMLPMQPVQPDQDLPVGNL